jgi:hypothetical protein
MQSYTISLESERIDGLQSCLELIRRCAPDMYLGGTYLRGQADVDWKLTSFDRTRSPMLGRG